VAHRLIWSPTARLDLADLYHYIAEANPSAARQFVRGVFHVIERLVDFPESGRIVP
jgi:toxin ParE1/3/4